MPQINRFLFANGLVLLMVTFVAFPTAVVARYLGTGAARGAVAFYCGSFFCISLAYQVLLRSVVHKGRLVRPEVPDDNLGLLVYAASVAVVLWNAIAGLLLCASLWVLWMRLCYRPLRGPEHAATRNAV